MLCAECKGRKGLCGLVRCPVISRFQAQVKAQQGGRSYMGGAPSVFVGSYNYPQVSGGPLMTGEPDSPAEWIAHGYGIEEIVGIRARTIRGNSEIRNIRDGIEEIAISSRPLDVEVHFERPVSFNLTFNDIVAPVGLRGEIKKMDVIDNPRVERAVDRIVSDTDLPATAAASALHRSEVDVHQITQLLTAGLLGKRRRIVPTRWAITAVDDTISKALRKEISRHPPLGEIQIFHATLHGNQICCLLLPGAWKFEMIEIWRENSLWSQGSETIIVDGEGATKSGYSPLAGAYYSARLAVTEYLSRIRRSAQVLIIRQVGNDYWAPLGTWVVREATRQALSTPPVICESVETGINAASGMLGSSRWRRHSRLIPEIMSQRSLFDF